MEQGGKITYLSNAGVMVDFNNKKILIDVLCNTDLPLYKNPPAELKEKIVQGITPFNNISFLLYTHEHSDHFEAKSTVEFLKNHDESYILANHKVMEEILSLHPGLDKKRWVDLSFKKNKESFVCNDINMHLMPMLHEGKEYQHVQNIAYLIEIAGKRILHVGDAKPCRENFIDLDLTEIKIDLLIAPFPYVALPSARVIIDKYIKPEKIAVIHLPHKEQDRWNWIESAKKSYEKVKKDFVETIFLEDTGDGITL